MNHKDIAKSFHKDKTNKSIFNISFLSKPELKKNVSDHDKTQIKVNPDIRTNKKRNTIKVTQLQHKQFKTEIKNKKLTVDFHYNRKDLTNNIDSKTIQKVSADTSQNPLELASVFKIMEVIHNFSILLKNNDRIFDHIEELFNETQRLKLMFPLYKLLEEKESVNKEVQENSEMRMNKYIKIFNNCNSEYDEITQKVFLLERIKNKNQSSLYNSINSSRTDTLLTKDSETRVEYIIQEEEDFLHEFDLNNCFDVHDKISQLPRTSKWIVRKHEDNIDEIRKRRDRRFNTQNIQTKLNRIINNRYYCLDMKKEVQTSIDEQNTPTNIISSKV